MVANFSLQHNDHFGDEHMMNVLHNMGRMGEKKRADVMDDLTPEQKAKVRAAAATNETAKPNM